MKTRIGFVILVWNSEKVIDKCLYSISNLERIEPVVIVVDNGSTDNTISIVEKYVTKFMLDIIRYEQNMGTTISRNAGIRKLETLKPDYYCVLDSDTEVNDDAFVIAYSLKNNIIKVLIKNICYNETSKNLEIYDYIPDVPYIKINENNSKSKTNINTNANNDLLPGITSIDSYETIKFNEKNKSRNIQLSLNSFNSNNFKSSDNNYNKSKLNIYQSQIQKLLKRHKINPEKDPKKLPLNTHFLIKDTDIVRKKYYFGFIRMRNIMYNKSKN